MSEKSSSTHQVIFFTVYGTINIVEFFLLERTSTCATYEAVRMINFFHRLTSLTFSYDFFAASITIAKMFSLFFFIHFKFKLSDEEIILFVSFSFSREFGKFDIVRGFVVFCNNIFSLYYLCVLRIRNELVLPFLIRL